MKRHSSDRFDRRDVLSLVGAVALGVLACRALAASPPDPSPAHVEQPGSSGDSGLITVFMCGDVMTGRGIDQVLPHPSRPRIYEGAVKSAIGYVKLAERAHGAISRPVGFSYVWGDALGELERLRPDVRIINLETAVTTSEEYWQGKGINYRMHPENIPCLTAAGIDCCALANNHVLDWGYLGLAETLDTLEKAGLKRAGAGRNREQAETPAVMDVPGKGRVIVFSFGSTTSGIPSSWAASEDRAGVNLLEDLSSDTVRRVAKMVGDVKRPGDIVVASIHWGSNWGYGIPREQRRFAQGLIDEAAVDVIHGHSSHHPKAIEVYRRKLILYGCGDFLNDYEGISGYEAFRDDLGLIYFVSVDPSSGQLVRLRMIPTQIRHFRVNRATEDDARWLVDVLNKEGKRLGTRVEMHDDGTFTLRWAEGD